MHAALRSAANRGVMSPNAVERRKSDGSDVACYAIFSLSLEADGVAFASAATIQKVAPQIGRAR